MLAHEALRLLMEAAPAAEARGRDVAAIHGAVLAQARRLATWPSLVLHPLTASRVAEVLELLGVEVSVGEPAA